jgi:hypothetical protein
VRAVREPALCRERLDVGEDPFDSAFGVAQGKQSLNSRIPGVSITLAPPDSTNSCRCVVV